MLAKFLLTSLETQPDSCHKRGILDKIVENKRPSEFIINMYSNNLLRTLGFVLFENHQD